MLEIHNSDFSTEGLGISLSVADLVQRAIKTNKKVQFLSGMVTHTCNPAFGRPRKRISGRGWGRGLESLPPRAEGRCAPQLPAATTV